MGRPRSAVLIDPAIAHGYRHRRREGVLLRPAHLAVRVRTLPPCAYRAERAVENRATTAIHPGWEAPPVSIVYAVFHCTLGNVIIGVGALLAALIVTRAGALRASPESGHGAQYTAKPVFRLCLQHTGCADRGGAAVSILRFAALTDDRCSRNELQLGVGDQ